MRTESTLQVPAPGLRGTPIVSRERVRTLRMQRHLVVAALACVMCVVIGPTVYSLPGLLTLSAFIGFVFATLARAVDARLGYWWGSLYGEPEYSTRLDLLVDVILGHLTAILIGHSAITGSAIDSVDNEPRVRILPLGPERR